MLEERSEEFASIEEMIKQPGEREEGPTAIEVSDRRVLIGEASVIVPKKKDHKNKNSRNPKLAEGNRRGE
jgi:hypothetical protein